MLKPTCDRKTKFHNSQRNTFGLYPGPKGLGTCPHATVGCGGCYEIKDGRKLPTCYVFRTMSAYKATAGVLEHNSKQIMTDSDTQLELLDAEFTRFEKAEKQREDPQLYYRLHWSGDIVDLDYACTLGEAIGRHPDITFWGYTRSLFAVPPLMDLPNLNLYISLDKVNFEAGIKWYRRYKSPKRRLSIALMADEEFYTEVKKKTRMKFVPCPVDRGKMPTEFACSKCRACIDPRRRKTPNPIWFEC